MVAITFMLRQVTELGSFLRPSSLDGTAESPEEEWGWGGYDRATMIDLQLPSQLRGLLVSVKSYSKGRGSVFVSAVLSDWCLTHSALLLSRRMILLLEGAIRPDLYPRKDIVLQQASLDGGHGRLHTRLKYDFRTSDLVVHLIEGKSKIAGWMLCWLTGLPVGLPVLVGWLVARLHGGLVASWLINASVT